MTNTFYAKVAVQNLGAYNEGELRFKWLDLPVDEVTFLYALKEIGVDGEQYEEYEFADFDTNIPKLADRYSNASNIDELNDVVEVFIGLEKVLTLKDSSEDEDVLSHQNYNKLTKLAEALNQEEVIENLYPLSFVEQHGLYPKNDDGTPNLVGMFNALKDLRYSTNYVRIDGSGKIYHVDLVGMKNFEDEVIEEYFKTV